MVTLRDIDELHARSGRAESLGDYFRGLAALGVTRFETLVSDGHTEYVLADGSRLVSPPHHETFRVAAVADGEAVQEHLRRHAEGETSYVEMAAALAGSGVAMWVGDTAASTMSYCDLSGVPLLVEAVH